MHGPQRRPGLDPEFPDQHPACIPVGLQRLGLPPGPGQGGHQLGAEVLVQRMTRRQVGQRGDQALVLPQMQPGLGVPLPDLEMVLIQPG
jgi:hypothetical protein